MGVEANRSALRAPIGTRDSIREDPGLDRSILQLRAKVETRRATSFSPEGAEDLRSHLIADPADRRTQVHGEITGTDTVAASRLFDGQFEDPCGGAFPTGMEEGDTTPLDVGDERRNAVGSRDREQDTRRRGHETVRRADDEHASTGRRVHLDNSGSVYLAPDDRGVHAGGAGESLVASGDLPGASARIEAIVPPGAGSLGFGYDGHAGHDSGGDSFPVREPVAWRAIEGRRDTGPAGQELSSTRSMLAPRERRRSSIRSYPRSI